MTTISESTKNNTYEHDDEYYQNLDYDNFDDFLCEHHSGKLIEGIYAYGFERPSAIQAKAIQPIVDGRDLIAQARSGSGKTGAFVIGALTRINPALKCPQAMIVGNTRELAVQICNVLKNIAIKMDIDVSLCIGGTGGGTAVDNLKNAYTSHVLVGTPGRLCDLINRDVNNYSRDSNTYLKKNNYSQSQNNSQFKKTELLKNLQIFVMDEADALLNDIFVEQIKTILGVLPPKTRIAMFSATYPPEMLKLVTNFMKDPIEILIEPEKVSVDLIKNYYINADREENKYDILVDLYQRISVCQAVIFTNSVAKAIEVSNKLKKDGHSVGTLHAQMDDVDRIDVLKNFRLGQTRILVATDVIARGIDIQQVGLVINYDVPYEPENYIHRVGRSGRYGKVGVAITFVIGVRRVIGNMKNIQHTYSINFMELPELDEVNKFLTGHQGYTFGS